MMITLTATYGVADETAPTGYVDIQPMITAVNLTTIITQAPVRGTLDAEGKFTVQIVASDDAGWDNGPIPYIFREFVNGQTAQWMAYVNGPGPVDISDLVPLSEAPVLTSMRLDDLVDVDVELAQNGHYLGFLDGLWIPIAGGGGGGGVTDHGMLTGLSDPDHQIGSVQGLQAALDGKADDDHVHATSSSVRRFALENPATTTPSTGEVSIATTTGQGRTFRVSKTDTDGVGYNLAPLLPGDGITVTDDPDTPPVTGFARYTVTTDVIDAGTFWQFDATRTDTSGTTTPPANGTTVRFIPTMSGGATTGGTATTRVTRPNTDDRLIEVDNGDGWSVADYDSGWRDVSSLLQNGWVGEVSMSRSGRMVSIKFSGLSATGATDPTVLTLPTGFIPDHSESVGLVTYIAQQAAATTGVLVISIMAGGQANPYSIQIPMSSVGAWMYGNTQFACAPDLPASLPGTLVTPAPA